MISIYLRAHIYVYYTQCKKYLKSINKLYTYEYIFELMIKEYHIHQRAQFFRLNILTGKYNSFAKSVAAAAAAAERMQTLVSI